MSAYATTTTYRQHHTSNRATRITDLETRIARLEQYLETQHTITRIIATACKVESALPQILQAICETADWDFGEVWYVNRQDNQLHCESTWLRPALQLPRFETSGQAITFKLGKGLPGRVWASGQPAWVPNVVVDKNFKRSLIAEQDGLRAGIAIPIRTEGEIIGILTFFSRHLRQVDKELLQILYTAGNQIGLFIERKRAEQEEREHEWHIVALEERQRLARDLHDSVTQTLFSASVVAEMLPVIWANNPNKVESSLQEVHTLTREALTEMRSMVAEMRTPSPKSSDLTIMMNRLVEKLTTRKNIAVKLDIQLPVNLPDRVQMTLYRITQETLNNIAKHADASNVWIRLYVKDDSILLCIKDNGRGFDLAHIPKDHFGIAIMRERAETIGATFHIASKLGKGTCTYIRTPLL